MEKDCEMKNHFPTTDHTDLHGSEEQKRTILSVFIRAIRGSKKSGAALLIALTFLVLLSAVVLALFSSSRTDRQNAAAFASGQETMRLAETAVDLVQGQIRDASTQPRVAWASQPGMVRTFDTAGNVTAYKLYSSDVMVKANYAKADMDTEVTAMQSWNAGATNSSFNALYADLNSPAVVKRPDPADATKVITTPVFPIADPAAIGAVEGFSANATVAGTTLSGNGTDRRLPMPVKWIYILKDGQMTAPSSGNATTATFTGSPLPSQDNPIVGRIAFWADDDTCKLNINTASQGTFWDVPKATTWSEVRMSIAMPVQGEFQRMVGHAATTSLSPVFSSLSSNYSIPTSLIDAASIASEVSNPDSYYGTLANYYSLTPRITGSADASDNSSKGGAQRTSATGRQGTSEEINGSVWPGTDQSPYRKGSPLLPDSDRLYDTPDELLFKPDRTPNLDFTASFLSNKTFFITAQSRAPETTLFGTPRISMWPQQTLATDSTGKDRLINFCSKVGNSTYSFQRGIATAGLFAASQPADSPTSDIQIQRNQDLIGYLRKLSATTIPGYGKSFNNKWSADGADKVIAQVFDTVRANINNDYVTFGNTTYRYAVTTTDPRGKVSTGGVGTQEDQSSGPRNYVIPAKLSSSAIGMGRNITISQFALVFMASKISNTIQVTWKDDPSAPPVMPAVPPDTYQQISDGETVTAPPTKAGYVIDTTTLLNQTTLEVRAFLVFQPYLAAQGTPMVVPGTEMEIQGLNTLTLNGTPFVPSASTIMRFGSLQWQGNRDMGTSDSFGNVQTFANYPTVRSGNISFGGYPQTSYFKEAKNGGADKDTDYPFVSPSIPVIGPTINFQGGTITVILKSWKNAEEYQRMTVNIPSAPAIINPQHIQESDTKFVDGAVTNMTFPLSQPPSFANGDLLSVRKRLVGNSNSNVNSFSVIRPGDVVCSVEWDPADSTTKGDFRLLALSPNAASFAKVAGYGTAANAFPGTSVSQVTPLVGRFSNSLRSSSVSQYSDTSQYGWKKGNGNQLAIRSTIDMIGGSTTLVPGVSFNSFSAPTVPAGLSGALLKNGALGDWASGVGANTDGAFFNRPDSGDSNKDFGGYFGDKYFLRVGAGDTYEPNRSVPSAGILAGLMTPDSTGTLQPWQTLLFNPRPAGGNQHPGFGSPPDHLYVDNFWMPVVEPYPISDPLSTAGKVNLNFQMMPFTHIERSTALRGALVPLMVSAVGETLASTGNTYKNSQYTYPIQNQIRFPLDRNETINEFAKIFSTGGIYQCATQVSESSLVPQGTTGAGLNSWWSSRRVTSDTLREQPYTALLSRVTTKSNTFTVHYRVQALRQPPRAGRNWAEWVEGQDQVTGEYRGSTTVERFLDPNAPNIPDYTQVNLSGTYDPIDKWYRWRVVSQNQFAP
jgi:uncharacterized protein (TIGR02600 family)